MEKLIRIGDKEVGFKATASTTTRYRKKFNRDLFKDIESLIPKVNEGELSVPDLECFMNISYIMAYQYDNTIPEDQYAVNFAEDRWLDEILERVEIYHGA